MLYNAAEITTSTDGEYLNPWKKTEWATYRQALRDLPESVTDARTFNNWPNNPDWVEPLN